ncbi:SpoIIE family protein phosphatase [bacterium]|nr:SpoIIE family protein phosphatase [bacterium]
MEKRRKEMLEEAIGKAVKREIGAYNYYIKEAVRSDCEEAEALFLHLANEEEKHKSFLQEELKRIRNVDWDQKRQGGACYEKIRYHIPEMVEMKQSQPLPFVDLSMITLPSTFLSGDHLQSFTLPLAGKTPRFGLFLHDVMGHGSKATHLNSLIKLFLGKQIERWQREQTGVDLSNPSLLLQKLNSHIYPTCHSNNKFVTAFYAVIDFPAKQLLYASAGHEPPVIIRANGDYSHLDNTELVLGGLETITYTNVPVDIRTGDTIVLFSDGITEVADNQERMFERSSVISAVKGPHSMSASEILNNIMHRVREHVGEEPVMDDFSVAVIKIIDP